MHSTKDIFLVGGVAKKSQIPSDTVFENYPKCLTKVKIIFKHYAQSIISLVLTSCVQI